MEKQELKIGKNYGGVFGLNLDKGEQMIYEGGITWTGKSAKGTKTLDSQKMTDNALEYINSPTSGTYGKGFPG